MNPPQREAVLHTEGPLVVFAGAGSGKTRVITHRIAHLVRDHDVFPSRILAVTFTNKAAGEMRQRLESLIPGGARGMWVGTFHSLCARLLRKHADEIGIRRDFTIYDDQDQRALLKRILKRLRLDPKEHSPKVLANRIGREKQEMRGPDAERPPTLANRVLEEVYEAYEADLRKASAFDFGDLIYQLVRALEANAELRKEIAGKFRYTLVDEFQDTNHAQLRLVDALVSVHGNVCVVGDDDQSIYRWRGADRRNILDFKRYYPDTRIIKLEQNYRSTQRILRAAHAIISPNVDREPKELFTENEEGDLIRRYACADAADEARTIVGDVKTWLREDFGLDEMAVLYRTHAQSRPLEEALRAANLPYKIIGGVRFYDRAEIKDALAYLRLLHNPEDDVSVLRVLNVPARGIGKTSEQRVLDVAAAHGVGVFRALELVAAGEDREGVDPSALPAKSFGAAAKRRIGEFVALVHGLREVAPELGLAQLTQEMLERSGYLSALEKQDTVEAESRRDNLGEFVSSVATYVSEHEASGAEESATLATFLERVALETQADEVGDSTALTLMTVHAAKGLEFPVVFVAGLEDGLFPRVDDFAPDVREELEEERRLAYVAITRAEERLVLTHAASRMKFGRYEAAYPSRFLSDIPEGDVELRGTSATGYGGYGGYGGSRGRSGGGARLSWSGGGAGRASSSRTPAEDPYASFRRSRAAESERTGETYVDMDEGYDIDPTEDDAQGFRPGARVFHPKFGAGRVVSVRGDRDPAVVVDFEGGLRRTLKASFLRRV